MYSDLITRLTKQEEGWFMCKLIMHAGGASVYLKV